MRALDLHLAQWEWASTAGRLEREYRELLISYRFGADNGYGGRADFYANEERNLLNTGKTCFITSDMIELAKYMAGVEMIYTGENVNLAAQGSIYGEVSSEETDLLIQAFGNQKGMSLHLDETKVPVLRREMLPAETGFMILEKPFPYADYDERIVLDGVDNMPYLEIKAIGWKISDYITTAADRHKSPGIVFWCYVGSETLELAKHKYEKQGWHVPPLLMVDFSGWSFDTEFEVGPWSVPNEDELGLIVRPHVASIRMFMAAVWGLMNSYIVSQKPTRQQMKLQKRLKMPEDGDVTVIHLRKFLSTVKNKTTAEDYDEEGNPNWSHRWIVRGHWAWRACGCPEHDGRHRVYIDPYIKGPEHLPLVIKEKVLSIDR